MLAEWLLKKPRTERGDVAGSTFFPKWILNATILMDTMACELPATLAPLHARSRTSRFLRYGSPSFDQCWGYFRNYLFILILLTSGMSFFKVQYCTSPGHKLCRFCQHSHACFPMNNMSVTSFVSMFNAIRLLCTSVCRCRYFVGVTNRVPSTLFLRDRLFDVVYSLFLRVGLGCEFTCSSSPLTGSNGCSVFICSWYTQIMSHYRHIRA